MREETRWSRGWERYLGIVHDHAKTKRKGREHLFIYISPIKIKASVLFDGLPSVPLLVALIFQAGVARDALTKSLYARLFDWLGGHAALRYKIQ